MNKAHYNRVVGLLNLYEYVDGAMDYCLLPRYAKLFNLNTEQRLWLAYLYGLSYSCSTAIRIQHAFPTLAEVTPKALKEFWRENRETLYFNRDRRYLKNNNQVIPAIKCLKKLTHGSIETYLPLGFQNLYKEIVKNWDFFGQMGAFLFFDALYGLCPELYRDAETLKWCDCSKPVRECAAIIAECEVSRQNYSVFDEIVAALKKDTAKPIIFIESTLCAYYKMLKGTRYLGFYADRLLEEVTEYQRYMPKGVNLWDYRQQAIPVQLRGEYNHRWTGIRKGLCKPLEVERVKAENTPPQIINIRGTNGAGKSTPLILLRELDPDMFEVKKPVNGKNTVIATVYPNYKVVALGKYSNKCGGVDSLKDGATVRKSLKYALKTYPEYTVIFEGIVVSTIFKTYADLFTELEEKRGLKTKILYFMPPLETCIKRIYKRNGGKAINESLVEGKYRTMERGIEKFKTAGFNVQVVDNSTWKKKDCVEKFLNVIKES